MILLGIVEKKLYLYIKIRGRVQRPPPAYYRNITHMTRVAPYGPSPHYIIKIRK